MEKHSVETVIRRFNESGVRYLVVGGLAVVAHGYVRFTADFDLMLDLENAENVRIALEVLKSAGYTPRVPVPIEQFADVDLRMMWQTQKNLLVFSLWSDQHPQTEIDLFVSNPLDFSAAYERSVLHHSENVAMRVVALEDLIFLKEQANRPKDQIDIEYLRRAPRD